MVDHSLGGAGFFFGFLIWIFFRPSSIWRFIFPPKFSILSRASAPPLKRLNFFFGLNALVSPIFGKVLIVVAHWNLVYILLIPLSIWCFLFFLPEILNPHPTPKNTSKFSAYLSDFFPSCNRRTLVGPMNGLPKYS